MADETPHFPTPKRRLIFEKYSFKDAKKRYEKQIKEHFYNHCVSVMMPETVKDERMDFLHSSDFLGDFLVATLPVHLFTDKEFIEHFVRNGSITALSYDTHIDTENCIALLPTGKLVLSLDKDIYEELGIPGKKSIFVKSNRFVVEVDVKAASFTSGKKLYSRVRQCFKRHAECLTNKYLLMWTDQGGVLDNGKLQSFLINYESKLLKTKRSRHDFHNVLAPVLDYQHPKTSTEAMPSACDAAQFHEWLGCMECGVDCSKAAADSYTSRLTCPVPSHHLYRISNLKWTGFIATQSVINILHKARTLFEQDRKPPWITLTVWGFADSPVSWSDNEHGFQIAGDNVYTFVLFPDDSYWCFIAMGSHDVCS
ncbi:predicted protein [Nematostella vectensis]|uniref:Uncharacterized protein n=1 Tax=Nematostella vectensis TaxID=45351 RepID=A7RPW7_NEMVE|nr:ribonuclease P protein subunit p40 [Nematostella vectensis]EDO46455.1 predicted protein [Nematostella vectensis]|eukprot:XP_001638518.1 predicted protein [Nematostella vectensis]